MTDFYLEATTASADAPNIPVGIYDAVVSGLGLEDHPDWAGTDQFGKHDDGRRIRWSVLLADDDGSPLYVDGDPAYADKLTNTKLNPKAQTKSGGIKILEAILPAADYAAFAMGLKLRDEDVRGRPCQVQVGQNDAGWPTIVSFMPPRRGFRPAADFLPTPAGFAGVEAVS